MDVAEHKKNQDCSTMKCNLRVHYCTSSHHSTFLVNGKLQGFARVMSVNRIYHCNPGMVQREREMVGDFELY